MESMGVIPRQTLSRDLSKAPVMQLGPITLLPSVRTIENGARKAVLEPRVMRVLVVLTEARGEVLSRDDLIDLAWDGVVVGDNAINRVISLLRKSLAQVSGGRVRLETITKVGFRLVADESVEGELPKRVSEPVAPLPDRRTVIGGGLAAAAGAIAWFWGDAWRRHVPDARARELWERGQLIQKTGEPGTMETAMGFYKQAIEIDPDYADAWGALAIAYRHSLAGFSGRKTESYDALARSAARRALELDPDQPDADAVAIMFKPRFGRLAAADRELRGLVARHPGYWYGLGQFAIALREGGRIKESLEVTRKQVSIDPMLPVAWANLANAEAFDGNLQDADQAIDRGLDRFPTNLAMWSGHFWMLMSSDRFAEAAAVIRDIRERPEYIPADEVAFLAGIADALSARSPAATSRWGAEILSLLDGDVLATQNFAPVLFQFGLADEAFAASERYFAAAREPDFARFGASTQFLFHPAVLRHRNHPRFTSLLETTGLEAYWAETGSQPDFRRS